MAIISIPELETHLGLDDDSARDTSVMQMTIDAAQQHIEHELGYSISDQYDITDLSNVPPALRLAVTQLAAWWYEQREAAIEGSSAKEIPFGVRDVVNNFRERTY